jgi:hypothetical protein
MELEDERQSFLDEGVYDVVNSICGCMLSGCATNGNQLWYEGRQMKHNETYIHQFP